MPKIADLTLKPTPSGTEEIALNDSGADRKTTIAAIRQPAASHITNQSNPHNVTKTQVGLGNVDNTSDMNKPVSTAQSNAITALSATLAPRGLLSNSGLTLPGTGLAGRQAAGNGPMQLITIGGGLSMNEGVLSAPAGVNLVNQRFTEVDTTTTDTDYAVVLTGGMGRTLTLSASAPAGKEILAVCETSALTARLTVLGTLGGAVVVPYRSSVLFFKSTLGWHCAAEYRRSITRIFNHIDHAFALIPPDTGNAVCLAAGPIELELISPTTGPMHPVTIHSPSTSAAFVQVNGHINGVDGAFVILEPGETATFVPTETTWRLISQPLQPRYTRLSSNVVANGTANALVDLTGLAFSVTAATYRFKFWIPYNAAATTTGCRFTINGPAQSLLNYNSSYPLTASTETLNRWLTAYQLPAASNATSMLTGNMAVIEGLVTFTAAGTLVPQFANEVTSSAITALAGATGELIRVG